MITHKKLIVGLLFILSGGIASAYARQEAEAPSEDMERALGPRRMPAVRLAPVPDFDNETTYLTSIRERVLELQQRADTIEHPALKVESWLAAANLMLSYELEPFCSARLLGIPASPEPDVAEATARELLEKITSTLARAEETLTSINADSDEEKQQQAVLRQRANMLRAFSSAIRVYLFPGSGEQAEAEWRAAASALAPHLEHEDRQVVAAATLWQSCLRAREEDPTPALARLDWALSDPPRATLPYGFFSRVLRCQLLAEHDRPVAALALLMQIEERCEQWFATEVERTQARRALLLARWQVLNQWQARLPVDPPEERVWCLDQMTRLSMEFFGEDQEAVIRLRPAVPVVAPPPDTRTRPVGSVSEPR